MPSADAKTKNGYPTTPPHTSYDVVIIGSGAGGGTSAWALSKAGLKVLLLEAGPAYDAFKDYRLDTPEWESSFPNKIDTSGRQVFAEMKEPGQGTRQA